MRDTPHRTKRVSCRDSDDSAPPSRFRRARARAAQRRVPPCCLHERHPLVDRFGAALLLGDRDGRGLLTNIIRNKDEGAAATVDVPRHAQMQPLLAELRSHACPRSRDARHPSWRRGRDHSRHPCLQGQMCARGCGPTTEAMRRRASAARNFRFSTITAYKDPHTHTHGASFSTCVDSRMGHAGVSP